MYGYRIVNIDTGAVISKTPKKEVQSEYPEMKYLFQINRKQFLKSLQQ